VDLVYLVKKCGLVEEMPMLRAEPERVEFQGEVLPQRTYKETIKLHNTLASPVVFSLRTSAPARLSVVPAECSLEAGESCTFHLKLHFSQPPSQLKAGMQQAFRDTLFIQSTYFQQKLPVSFTLLAPDPSGHSTPKPSQGGATEVVETSGTSAGRERVVVGGGPAGYRALLTAEFEEKSEKVLAILTAKDGTIERLKGELVAVQAEVDGSRAAATQALEELERS
jgi:hypothetical protein